MKISISVAAILGFSLSFHANLHAAMCKAPDGTIIVNEERGCAPGNMCRDEDRNWSFEACAQNEARLQAAERDRAGQRARADRQVAEMSAAREAAESRARDPWLGMKQSEAAVIEPRWGTPLHKNVTTVGDGTHEQWVYSGNRFLYFDNGVLTAIQE